MWAIILKIWSLQPHYDKLQNTSNCKKYITQKNTIFAALHTRTVSSKHGWGWVNLSDYQNLNGLRSDQSFQNEFVTNILLPKRVLFHLFCLSTGDQSWSAFNRWSYFHMTGSWNYKFKWITQTRVSKRVFSRKMLHNSNTKIFVARPAAEKNCLPLLRLHGNERSIITHAFSVTTLLH